MSQPLYTLTALDFLTDILRPEWRVFEYGSGRSTTWYVERCAEVHAVEHSGQWDARSHGGSKVQCADRFDVMDMVSLMVAVHGHRPGSYHVDSKRLS